MSYQIFSNSAAPSTPSTGKTSQYVDTTGRSVALNSTGVLNMLAALDRRNWLANSGFWFAQRQTPGTLTTYSSVGGRLYGADRWFMSNENASVQYQRIDSSSATEAGLQSRYYGRFKKITSAGKMFVGQVLEGDDATQLRGRSVRVQALLKCTVAGSMNVRLGLIQLTSAGTLNTIPSTAGTFVTAWGGAGIDPTLGTNLSYIAPKSGVSADGGTVVGNAVDCALTTSWARFGAVFDVPSNCKNLILAIWTNAQPAANDELNIAQPSLTDGMEIQEWSPNPVQPELARCQRYYCKSFTVDQAPAQNAGVGGSKRGSIKNAGAVTTSWNGNEVRFPVQMRATPTTVTFYNPSAANAFVRNITLGTDATATSAANTTECGMHVNCTGVAAWAVGNDSGIHWSADAEL